ncbi:MAG TPA: PP2C family protein-serine/threonine phosphatase [Blastocatellia bacterium]|nr:PP2C family protein-serine/threonine phosphatase [Blastocatellia bacterium]
MIAFLLGAGVLLYLGRDLVQGSAFVTWGLTFAASTSVAVLIASLYRVRIELQASRHQLARKDAELSFALEVQRALFPRQLPEDGGLEFSAICIPARGISGDYYDVMRLPDGRLVFAIADISGKGISAAILMANLQALLRALALTLDCPTEICSHLNRHLYQVTDSTRFATFFYAEWRPTERTLRYVNAGHHPPVFFANSGSSNSKGSMIIGGLPLGVFPEAEFQSGEVGLNQGDLMVLYSDGVTEAASEMGEEFGEKRLQQLVASNGSRPLSEVRSAILDAVGKWSGQEQEDDMTLLLVRAGRPEETQ